MYTAKEERARKHARRIFLHELKATGDTDYAEHAAEDAYQKCISGGLQDQDRFIPNLD